MGLKSISENATLRKRNRAAVNNKHYLMTKIAPLLTRFYLKLREFEGGPTNKFQTLIFINSTYVKRAPLSFIALYELKDIVSVRANLIPCFSVTFLLNGNHFL